VIAKTYIVTKLIISKYSFELPVH